MLAIKRAAEAKLGGVLVQGWRAYCSPTFFDALTRHATVKEAYKAWEAAQERLGGDMRKGFNFGGVEWIEYGASVGETAFIPDKKATVFPVAAGLYKLYNGSGQLQRDRQHHGRALLQQGRAAPLRQGVRPRGPEQPRGALPRPLRAHRSLLRLIGSLR